MTSALTRRFGVFAAVAVLLFVSRAAASTLFVTNNFDAGPGSLRQAIADNLSLGGGNTIAFSNNVVGTISLTTGELLISANLTLVGPGANVLAIDGNGSSRVFHVTNCNVGMTGITITNGRTVANAGAGIRSDYSTMTLSNCTVCKCNADNGGGGIFTFFGGGLTLLNSTIWGNKSTNGGGVNFSSPNQILGITNCTFSGNQAIGQAGGAISLNYGTLYLISSTVASNSGPNGSAIANLSGNPAAVGDCALINNTAPSIGGSVTSFGYNNVTDTDAFNFTQPTDHHYFAALGQLQNNGGTTPTHMPLDGALIDEGKNLSGLLTDQRGRYRIYDDPNHNAFNAGGDFSDIGAVEFCPARGIVATNADSGPSLRWCINDAQSGDTITFSNGVVGTIYLTNGAGLSINKNLTITGPGPNVIAIDGTSYFPGFNIGPYAVNISGLTITNTSGAVSSFLSTLSLSNCIIINNSANIGAGLVNNGNGGVANATVVDTTFTGNVGNFGYAGAVYNYGFAGNATCKLIRCTFNGNSASNGAAIFNTVGDSFSSSGAATLLMTNCTLANNACTGNGAIYNSGGATGNANISIIACTLSSNSAPIPFRAAGIYNSGPTALVEIGNTILRHSIGSNIVNFGGAILSDGFNLSSDNASTYLHFATDQNNTDPLLGPLRNNGGLTQTIALRFGSPARDKGKSFGLTTDQRGAPRPVDFANIGNATGGDGADIGAFESGNPMLTITAASPNVIVSWPAAYGSFTLESSMTIDANSWTTVPGSPSVVGDELTITNTASGLKFYRLRGL